MSLTLRVLATDQNVFDGSADEVILPSTTGQLGILPGHISLLTAIDIGVLRVRANGAWNSIALMGGFAEVDADEVTVLVNKAELGSSIDAAAAAAAIFSADKLNEKDIIVVVSGGNVDSEIFSKAISEIR